MWNQKTQIKLPGRALEALKPVSLVAKLCNYSKDIFQLAIIAKEASAKRWMNCFERHNPSQNVSVSFSSAEKRLYRLSVKPADYDPYLRPSLDGDL